MRWRKRGSHAAVVAAVTAVVATMTLGVASAEELERTVSPVVTAPASVTARQGETTLFTMQMTASGTLPCDPSVRAWAAVHSRFEGLGSGAGSWFVADRDLTQVDFFADEDCNVTWTGAPEAATINASFFAPCGMPPGTYRTPARGTVSGPPMSGLSSPFIDFVVEAANCPPVAVADAYSTTAGVPLQVGAPGVLANDLDPDGDPLSAALASGPAHGALTLNRDGSFSYAPDAQFVGTDSFTYRANDGVANSAIATVTIEVQDPSPPTVDYTLDPASPGDGGWYRDEVALSWQVEDLESGVTEEGCEDVTVSSDQAITEYSCTATSEGGQTGPVTVSIGFDATPPTLSTSLADGTVFVLGQTPPALSASDVVDPDPDGPEGPVVPSGVDESTVWCDDLDSSSVGLSTASCSVSDNAGNEASATVSYAVTHGFGGFSAPLPRSTVKRGSTLPVKFTVTDFSGSQDVTTLTDLRVRILGPASASAPCTYLDRIAGYQCDLKTPRTVGAYRLVVEQPLPGPGGTTTWVALGNASEIAGQPNANGEDIRLR
jgi:hypothetical protein